MANFIWIFTLVAVYITFMFMEPVKAPGVIIDRSPVVKEVLLDDAAKNEPKEKIAAAPAEPVQQFNPIDIQKGKEIYLSTCTKCHNKDPNVKGPIGPELVDAPVEIMAHKVEKGRYPEVLPAGFVPKRKTNQMIKQPQHLKDVPSIHAYIQSVKKSK